MSTAFVRRLLPELAQRGIGLHRSLDPDMPIILTTSWAAQAIAAERDMTPRPTVFAKPYEYPKLAAEIERLVFSPRAP